MKLVEDLIKLPKSIRQEHLKLDEPCIERGGSSTQHRGILVEYLDTNFPVGCKTHLCHACHNDKCSNPQHLYWGTSKENVRDAMDNGTHQSIWDRMIDKHGLDEARQIQARKAGKMNSILALQSRAGSPGKAKSPEHRKKISEALKRA